MPRENWDRDADRELRRRERFIITENKKKEKQLQRAREKEIRTWTRESDREANRRGKFLQKLEEKNLEKLQKAREKEINTWEKESDCELKRRDKFMGRQQAKKTRARERAEFKKWNKEIRAEEKRPPPAFKVVRTYSNANARFTTYFDTYKVYVYGHADPVAVFKRQLDPGDKIRIIVSHPSWAHPFSTKLIAITNDGQFFYTLLKLVLGYVEYKEVPLNEVTIEVQSTRIPCGKGRLTITKDNTYRKRCIITVKNTDTVCLARAIVTAHANLNKDKWTKSQISNGFNKSRVLQETEALKLHEDAGVLISDHGNTLEDVNTFANHLGVQINVVDTDYFNEIVPTANPDSSSIIYLHKDKNHYDVITSMPAFLAKDYYCHTCKKGTHVAINTSVRTNVCRVLKQKSIRVAISFATNAIGYFLGIRVMRNI